MTEAILAIEDLRKSFGGVHACSGVTLDVREGEIHAIIGPNGAGKTTLVSMLAGEIAPDAGRIRFAGVDVTSLPVHRKVARGVARSYQITSLFDSMTVLENVALAVQRVEGFGSDMLVNAHRLTAVRRAAREILESNDLLHLQEASVRTLSYGDKRTLEICVALACQPRVLILDEPMAGMGVEESGRIIEMLARLRGNYTIVLVEHDMDAVFKLSDRITVLVEGAPIITDEPHVVRSDPAVRAAYLGEDDLP